MNSGSFDGGLLNLTNWIGNAVMPILAALILASVITSSLAATRLSLTWPAR